MKSSRMSWVRYVACIIEKRNVFRFLVGNPRERDPFEDLSERWEGTTEINRTII
jgi:hypothetical protein